MTVSAADFTFLVNQFGQNVTLRTVTSEGYNPSTASTTLSPVDYTVKVYFYDFRVTDIDGVNVVRGDRRVVIPVTDTSGNSIPEPQTNDLLVGSAFITTQNDGLLTQEDDSNLEASSDDKVSIVRVESVYSGSSPVLYLCQTRK